VKLKEALILLLALAILFFLSACGSGGSGVGGDQNSSGKTGNTKQAELVVFAAASLTDALTEIAKMYSQVDPNVKLVFNFDSSGTLKTQIEHGADCDIFISASQKAMDQLDINAGSEVNPSGLDFVIEDTRFDFVSNVCVLAVPQSNPAGIKSIGDVTGDSVSRIVLGNSDVPAGQYAQEIFEHLGIWDKIQDKITFASNVKEVTTQVAEMAADCGVVYGTDAVAAGLEIAAEAEEGWHSPVVYPAAVIKSTKNEDAARAFLEFLQTDEVREYLTSVGFGIPSN